MTSRTAYKTACLRYAKQAGIKIPDGFNVNDTYGTAARELTKKIQRKNKIKQDGNITPETVCIVGRYFPGSVGERAVWAMRSCIGGLEVWGENSGPWVEQIQRLGVNDFKPGKWAWCAATASWALRSAGWTSWEAFAKRGAGEAGVITWRDDALAHKYGLAPKSYRVGKPGDIIIYGSDAHHIGFLDSRVNPITGDCYSISGNTTSPKGGKEGLWRNTSNAAAPQMVISVS